MKESALLRLLDRYLGSLLCFALSLFRRTRPFDAKVERIVLIELFEMGASIMAIPAIRFIKEQRPRADIYVVTVAGNISSWEISGLIPKENILALDGRSLFRFVASAIKQTLKLRGIGIDLVVDFEKFSRISTILSIFAGTRRLAGFFRYEFEGLYRGSRLIDAPCAFNQNLHISQNFLALAKAAFQRDPHYPNLKESIDIAALTLPHYTISPERAVAVRHRLKINPEAKIILIAPDVGGNLQVRNYPVESYATTARALLDDDPQAVIVLIGVVENTKICAELEALIGSPRCRNMCGTTHSLDALMELFCISELLIGNDNGPLHFASLTTIKILGIFSTDSPLMYGPLGDCVAIYTFMHCSPCISALNHKRSKCTENACIKDIPPRYIAEMAIQHLNGILEPRTINGTTPYLLGRSPFQSIEPLISVKTSRSHSRERACATKTIDAAGSLV